MDPCMDPYMDSYMDRCMDPYMDTYMIPCMDASMDFYMHPYMQSYMPNNKHVHFHQCGTTCTLFRIADLCVCFLSLQRQVQVSNKPKQKHGTIR